MFAQSLDKQIFQKCLPKVLECILKKKQHARQINLIHSIKSKASPEKTFPYFEFIKMLNIELVLLGIIESALAH